MPPRTTDRSSREDPHAKVASFIHPARHGALGGNEPARQLAEHGETEGAIEGEDLARHDRGALTAKDLAHGPCRELRIDLVIDDEPDAASRNPGGAPATLPGLGSTTGGSPGQANGTVMSYCHLLSGGVTGNVSYTFGQGHPYGVAPDRVPAQMVSHVVSRAASFPACLGFEPGTSVIFRHGFNNGSTTGWSATAP